MSRRSKPERRIPAPDPIYNNVDISKFINRIMRRGKKSLAEKIFYGTMEKIKERTNENPIETFEKALQNATPLLEVKADRGFALASSWIIAAAKNRGGKSFIEKLTNELMDASNGVGAACKKREDTHKMAEANKAFAHYR